MLGSSFCVRGPKRALSPRAAVCTLWRVYSQFQQHASPRCLDAANSSVPSFQDSGKIALPLTSTQVYMSTRRCEAAVCMYHSTLGIPSPKGWKSQHWGDIWSACKAHRSSSGSSCIGPTMCVRQARAAITSRNMCEVTVKCTSSAPKAALAKPAALEAWQDSSGRTTLHDAAATPNLALKSRSRLTRQEVTRSASCQLSLSP